jgi:hypothetical protein
MMVVGNRFKIHFIVDYNRLSAAAKYYITAIIDKAINPAVINLYLQFSQVVDFTNVFAKNNIVLSAPG